MTRSHPTKLTFAKFAQWVVLLAAIKGQPIGIQLGAIGAAVLVGRFRRRMLDSLGGTA